MLTGILIALTTPALAADLTVVDPASALRLVHEDVAVVEGGDSVVGLRPVATGSEHLLVSAPVSNPGKVGALGDGWLGLLHADGGAVAVRVDQNVSLVDLAEALNKSGLPVEAAVLKHGSRWRLAVALDGGGAGLLGGTLGVLKDGGGLEVESWVAFEDTGTMHVDAGGWVEFEDTGTLHK